jgi:hypothetical protein
VGIFFKTRIGRHHLGPRQIGLKILPRKAR